jgi:hypothetical protein
MNYVLLQRMLQVAGSRGNVEGDVAIGKNEAEWIFTPREAWKAGDYKLVVNTALEDLAGNSLALAFDIDVFEKVTERISTATISLPFRVQ